MWFEITSSLHCTSSSQYRECNHIQNHQKFYNKIKSQFINEVGSLLYILNHSQPQIANSVQDFIRLRDCADLYH